MKKLEDDHYCFVCGEQNPRGFPLTFSLHEDSAVTEFIPQKIHQGYKDIVHGGIISTLLDEAMVKAALLRGIPAITAEITVRFRNPLIVGERVIIEASIIRMNKKIHDTSARVRQTTNTS